jgi:hypothetical protein
MFYICINQNKKYMKKIKDLMPFIFIIAWFAIVTLIAYKVVYS